MSKTRQLSQLVSETVLIYIYTGQRFQKATVPKSNGSKKQRFQKATVPKSPSLLRNEQWRAIDSNKQCKKRLSLQ